MMTEPTEATGMEPESLSSPTVSALPVGARLAERSEGLAPRERKALASAGQLIDRRKLAEADAILAEVHRFVGDHPEYLRLLGVTRFLQKKPREAIDLLRKAIAAKPDDALLQTNLGSVLNGSGDHAGAAVAFGRACDLDPALAAPWFNLGTALAKQSRFAEALEALDQAIRRDEKYVAPRLARADVLFAVGRTDESAVEYRHVIQLQPASSAGWIGLSNIKTLRLSAEETQVLEDAVAAPDTPEPDRVKLGFVLGKALEDAGRYQDAFTVLGSANAAKRRELTWDPAFFSAGIDRVIEEFSRSHRHAASAKLGEDVVFIVSLPRAGSTLTEQILSAHGDVTGAGELPDLAAIMDAESRQRGMQFPDWVADASAADWERLGMEYVRRTAHWRRDSPRSTDKGLTNWTLIGAAHAMLPGARFVHARRDAVETCWSCFKQLFRMGQNYSYDFAELAAQWRDYDRLMRFWHARYPHRVYELGYERLIAEPEAEVRRVLGFLKLPYDEACLRFNESTRVVRTVSGAQVRQPLRSDTARSAAYGPLLAPLRWALGMEPLSF